MSETNWDEIAIAVIDRLNREKRAWSFEIVAHLVFEREVVVLGRLVVDGVTKMSFGASVRDRTGAVLSVGTLLQAAANEALVRAARLFGVGLVFERSIETSHSAATADGNTAVAENRITQRQLGALQGHVRRRNLRRSDLGDLLRERFGKSELVTLTRKEASDLLTAFAEVNGRPAA